MQRTTRLALSVLALLVVIATFARFARNDDSQALRRSPQSEATPTSVATPESTPTAAAIANPAPTPLTLPPPPSPTPLPYRWQPGDTPDDISGAFFIGDQLAVLETRGLWLAEQHNAIWYLIPLTEEPLSSYNCRSELDGQLIYVSDNPGASGRSLVVIDPISQQVLDAPLPPVMAGDIQPSWCTGVVVGDRWVFAARGEQELVFALTSDRGASFSTTAIPYPAPRIDGGASARSSVRLGLTPTHLVLDACSGNAGVWCGVEAAQMPLGALDLFDQPEVSWVDAGIKPVLPTAAFAGTVDRDEERIAAERAAFGLVQVGDEVWQLELVRSAERGEVWAAGPVGTDLLALPPGLRPKLFPYGDTVVARVFGVRGATEPLALNPVSWYELAAESNEWQPLRESPERRWTNVSSPLSSLSRIEGDAIWVVPQQPEPVPLEPWGEFDQWDNLTAHISDQNLFVLTPENAVWSSSDRGESWYRDRLDDSYRLRPRCGHGVDGELASTNFQLRDDYGLRALVFSLHRETIGALPERARLPLDLDDDPKLIPPCRPLKLNDAWMTATVDIENESVFIHSTNDYAKSFAELQIDLSGQIADNMTTPYDTLGSTSADLYQDGDWLVVHVCILRYVIPCETHQISVHQSLIPSRGTSRVVVDSQAPQAEPLIVVHSDEGFGPAERLYQIGTELWRVDLDFDEPLGECICAEGASMASYFPEAGSRFDSTPRAFEVRSGDFSIRNGEVVTCGSDMPPGPLEFMGGPLDPEDFDHGCWQVLGDGSLVPLADAKPVHWDSVASDSNVTFADYDDGRILVTE